MNSHNGLITYSGNLTAASITSSSINSATITAYPTSEELNELEDDSILLYALIDAGVEDWPGYDDAIRLYNERKNQ